MLRDLTKPGRRQGDLEVGQNRQADAALYDVVPDRVEFGLQDPCEGVIVLQ